MSASLDGELTQKEKQVLDTHLSICAECACEYKALSGLRIAMSAWQDEEPSEWMAHRFAYKLREFTSESKAASGRKPRWVFGRAAAGVAAVVMLGLFIYSRTVELQKVPLKILSANRTALLTPGSSAVGLKTVPPTVQSAGAPNSATSSGAPIMTANAKPAGDYTPRTAKPAYKKTIRYAAQGYGRNHRQRRYSRQPVKPVLVAYAPRDNFGTSDLASRHAEQIIMQKMDVARSVEGETNAIVTNHLDEANLKMNETFERVRGTLRVAADLLSSERKISNDMTTGPNGGTIL